MLRLLHVSSQDGHNLYRMVVVCIGWQDALGNSMTGKLVVC